MISVDNITVSFSGEELLSDISLMINPRDRIGLVGRNGAGKTTLMKVIMGTQGTVSGRITKSADTTVGYLPQQMKVADTTSLYEETYTAFEQINRAEALMESISAEIASREDYESEEYSALLHRLDEANQQFTILGGASREQDIERTLLGLGFRREDFGKPTSQLSGGWRMRVELAKLLLRRPSVIMLDEPTNHLDIESIQWLEGYLKDYPGAVIVVSHDRMFLDNVTNRTVEILLGHAYDYKVPYSRYVELRRERREQQLAAYNNQQRMIEKSEEFIERFRYKPTKSNQVQSRIKQLEKIERIEVDEEDLSALNIKFPPSPHAGKIVAEAHALGKSFGSHHVFGGLNMTLEKGQKIALVGRNGEGKTTFARMLIGELEPSEGTVKLGTNISVGYYAQNQDDLMNGDFTVYDTLDKVAVGDIRTRLRDILGAFLFKGEDIDKKVRVLSGGERARLAMARMILSPNNLLVMDEPTNHMDMRSKDILKEALRKYDGTLVIISHDREFLDGIADKVLEFRDGGVREYLGDIRYFLEKRRLEDIHEIERRETKPAAAEERPAAGREDYLRRKENEKAVRKTRNAIQQTEDGIAALEQEIASYERRLADPAAWGNETAESLFSAYSSLKARLADMEHEWEKLNYEYEILTDTL